MAQKVNILLIDDVDGSEATQTVAFGLDGTDYEIDLNDDNAQALRDALAKFVGYSRKVTGGRGKSRRSSGSSSSSSSSEDTQAIREWAKENGIEVSERGRIAAEVREAYANRNKSGAINGTETAAPKSNARGGKRRTAEVSDDGTVKAK